MSGVQTGSRLERLEQLHKRVRLEVAAARRHGTTDLIRLQVLERKVARAIHAERHARPAISTAVRALDGRTSDQLARLGVTAHDVKVWAVGQGLLDHVQRGRVAADLVDAYEAAHRQESA